MTNPIVDYDEDGRLETGYSQVPHGLWTLDLPMGAKVLLGWLHSHSREHLRGLTWNVIRRAMGTSSIRVWLEALEAGGFVTLVRAEGSGRAARLVLHGKAYAALCGRPDNRAETGALTASKRAETGAVTAPKPARKEDQEKINLLERSQAAPRARNEDFDALAEACDLDPTEMTKSAARACGVALSEIRAAGGSRDQFPSRASRYRQKFPNAPLTPSALAKQWAACRPASQQQPQYSFDARGNRIRLNPDGTVDQLPEENQ